MDPRIERAGNGGAIAPTLSISNLCRVGSGRRLASGESLDFLFPGSQFFHFRVVQSGLVMIPAKATSFAPAPSKHVAVRIGCLRVEFVERDERVKFRGKFGDEVRFGFRTQTLGGESTMSRPRKADETRKRMKKSFRRYIGNQDEWVACASASGIGFGGSGMRSHSRFDRFGRVWAIPSRAGGRSKVLSCKKRSATCWGIGRSQGPP